MEIIVKMTISCCLVSQRPSPRQKKNELNQIKSKKTEQCVNQRQIKTNEQNLFCHLRMFPIWTTPKFCRLVKSKKCPYLSATVIWTDNFRPLNVTNQLSQRCFRP